MCSTYSMYVYSTFYLNRFIMENFTFINMPEVNEKKTICVVTNKYGHENELNILFNIFLK